MSVSSLQQQFSSIHHLLIHDSYQAALQHCDDLLQSLSSMQHSLQSSDTVAFSSQVKSFTNQLSAAKTQHSRSFKALYNETQRYSKQLDRVLTTNSLDTALLQPTVFDINSIDAVIIDTLCRDGRFDVAELYIKESGCEQRIDTRLQVMHTILAALEARDVLPCLAWAKEEEHTLMAEIDCLQSEKRQAEGFIDRERKQAEKTQEAQMKVVNMQDEGDADDDDESSGASSAGDEREAAQVVAAHYHQIYLLPSQQQLQH